MKKKILICDDDPRRVESWKAQLESVQDAFAVEGTGSREDFLAALSRLEERRKLARRKSSRSPDWGSNPLDEAAILIVDFDLLKMSQESYLTGENVAYLARCYSRCGLIVGLNQFGANEFDLTLKGHPESYADLNIGGPQLVNRGLWYRDKWGGFRPWCWPVLPLASVALEVRVASLMNRLDEPVLDFLQFSANASQALPRSISEFLGRQRKPQETTFRHFVSESGNGLRAKDRALDDISLARIAAARLSKWLERLVLPGQDILVDAPHLVSRFPSLLTGKATDIAAWNKTASLDGLAGIGLHYKTIERPRFKMEEWISRPAWFWPKVSTMEEIAEVKRPWSAQDRGTDCVFCEDISGFLPRDGAREFVADLPSVFVRRFVVNPRCGAGRKLHKALEAVSYSPGVRFSL
jgi:hypothetical protein